MSEETDLVESLRTARADGRRPAAPDADLRNADLRGANLWGANLRSADLWNADLRSADLRGADLWSANLWNANLRNADLWNANLRNANLGNANLRNANLGNAKWDGLCIDGLPSGRYLLIPTGQGWFVSQGCYRAGFAKFVAMTESDDWPESRGEEILRRRPLQQAAIALSEAHIDDHKKLGTIERLAGKWGEK